MKKIGIFGTGIVGRTLASKLMVLNYDVMMGTRNVKEKMADTSTDARGNPPFREWLAGNKKIKLGTFTEAAVFGEILVNATHGAGSISALTQAGAESLEGKTLLDVSNPLDFSKGMPPTLIPSYANTTSLAEEIQKAITGAKVVKTLNTMWCGLMVNPSMVNGGDHNVFVAGNDASAKQDAINILKDFGWMEENILDLGDITAARGTEMWLPLWLRIMGTKNNGAFNLKLVS